MDIRPEAYREAALERIKQARANFERGAFALAMYVAGVAVECMLRAYIIRRKGKGQLETGHNISLLLDESGLKRTAQKDKGKHGASEVEINDYRKTFEEHISRIRLSWSNDFRYASESRLKAELKKRKLGRRVKGDILKANAKWLIESASWIVQEGERLWLFEQK